MLLLLTSALAFERHGYAWAAESMPVAFDAIRSLRVGGLIVNGTSTWRTDQLAYGGVKSSGIGREGPRYAVRDMTEERLVLFNL